MLQTLKADHPRNPSAALHALERIPQVKAQLDAETKALAEQRALTAKALRQIEADNEKAFRAICAEEAAASDAASAAREALRLALLKLNNVVARRSAIGAQFVSDRARLEQSLIDSSSREITKFVDEMRGLWAGSMKLPARVISSVERNPNTGKVVQTAQAVGTTPAQRMKAIADVIAAAEALRLDPDQSEIPARLETLRASIPEIGANAP